MTRMIAKYNGRCVSCEGRVRKGQQIIWNKEGPFHPSCWQLDKDNKAKRYLEAYQSTWSIAECVKRLECHEAIGNLKAYEAKRIIECLNGMQLQRMKQDGLKSQQSEPTNLPGLVKEFVQIQECRYAALHGLASEMISILLTQNNREKILTNHDARKDLLKLADEWKVKLDEHNARFLLFNVASSWFNELELGPIT